MDIITMERNKREEEKSRRLAQRKAKNLSILPNRKPKNEMALRDIEMFEWRTPDNGEISDRWVWNDRLQCWEDGGAGAGMATGNDGQKIWLETRDIDTRFMTKETVNWLKKKGKVRRDSGHPDFLAWKFIGMFFKNNKRFAAQDNMVRWSKLLLKAKFPKVTRFTPKVRKFGNKFIIVKFDKHDVPVKWEKKHTTMICSACAEILESAGKLNDFIDYLKKTPVKPFTVLSELKWFLNHPKGHNAQIPKFVDVTEATNAWLPEEMHDIDRGMLPTLEYNETEEGKWAIEGFDSECMRYNNDDNGYMCEADRNLRLTINDRLSLAEFFQRETRETPISMEQLSELSNHFSGLDTEEE